MLKKRHKVTKEEFKTVFTKGAIHHSPHFVLRWHKNKAGTQGFRGSCVISKKVLGSAVLRNRTKRRCYHAVQTLLSPNIKPYTTVLIVKKPIHDVTFQDLKAEIKVLFTKAHVI